VKVHRSESIRKHQKSFFMRVDGTLGDFVLEKSPVQSLKHAAYLFHVLPLLHLSILQDLCLPLNLLPTSLGPDGQS